MKLRIIATLLLLSACNENGVEIPPSYFCDNYATSFGGTDFRRCRSAQYLYREDCDVKASTSFIISCAKAANPMSDEEGEDLVAECRRTALYLYCKKVYNIEEIKGK